MVPALCSGIILPLVFMRIYNPKYAGGQITEESAAHLNRLGPMSFKEKQLCVVLAAALGLWMTCEVTGISETFVAFLALVALLFLRTISWDDVSSNSKGYFGTNGSVGYVFLALWDVCDG